MHLLLFLLLAILSNAELPALNCSEKGKTVKSRSANEGYSSDRGGLGTQGHQDLALKPSILTTLQLF